MEAATWTDCARDRYKDDGRRYPSDLTDAEWATLASLMSVHRPLTADLREVVNARLYLEKAGCPWRFLPKVFDPWQTVRSWHDRFRSNGVWTDVAAVLARVERARRGRNPEPATAIMDSKSVASGPQAGERGVDGKKKVKNIKRHVLTCSLGFVLATLVTAANVHHTAAAGLLLDSAAAAGWTPEHVKGDGIYTGERMRQAAMSHSIEVQVTTRDRGVKGFQPLPLRWRIEGAFGTLTNRYHRLTRNLEQSPAAAEDAVTIANCHRLIRAIDSKA